MANTSSTHVLSVTDNGTLKARIKDANALNTSLEKAKRTAAGGTSAPAARYAAAGQSSRDSGMARGVGGLTGAEGRDFAKQSQGLGGLVRLYATFAANLFAATAAFGALSQAADTTNMVKGLDQLGASSGRNLGSLAQRVVKATDSAISLREAMESVSKASSAGLDTKQILAMTDAAKKASQALGVDMGDAMSRLTRGISKLEPELLDELGLFTKVDKSTQDYARSVGKTTASLTDFERRQAFANAVLDEAKQKFSVIDIPANPYNKLLASFKDVSQAGLELLNTVLGPLVRLLSESPIALGAVMAGIATMILKTAVPALGHWRQGLKDSASEAAKTAKAFRDSFGDEFQDRLNSSFKIPDLERNLAKANKSLDAAQAKLVALKVPASLSRAAPSIGKFMDEPESAENRGRLTRLIREREKRLEADIAGTKVLSAVKKQQTTEEIEDLRKILAAKKLVNAEEDKRIAAARALGNAQNSMQGAADKPLGRFDPERLAMDRATKLEQAASRSRLVSLAAEDAAFLGVRNSVRKLNNSLVDEGTTGWNKYSTLARGSLAAISSRVFGIIGALGNIGMAIGISIAAFEALSAVFGENGKQLEEFSSAIKTANSSAELMGKTLENNAKQLDFGVSIRGINALANAFKEVVVSVKDLTKSLEVADQSASWFDRMVDGFKGVVGKDLKTQYSKAVSGSIIAGLDSIKSPEAKKKAEDNIKALLKISAITKDSINNAMQNTQDSAIVGVGMQLEEVLSNAGRSAEASSISITAYSENMVKATKAFDEFSAGINDNSAFGKLGTSFVDVGFAISKTTIDIRTNMAALIDLGEDTAKLRFLGVDTQKDLLNILPKLKEARTIIATNTKAIADLDKVIEGANERKRQAGRGAVSSEDTASLQGAKIGKDILTAELQREVDEIRTQMEGRTLRISNEMLKAGDKMLNKALEAANAAARINYLKSVNSGMTGMGTSTVQAELQREEINAQLSVISAMEDLTLATLRSSLIMQETSLKEDLASEDKITREKAARLLPVVQDARGLADRADSVEITSRYNSAAAGELKAAIAPLARLIKESATQRAGLGGKAKVVKEQEQQGIAKEAVELEKERNQVILTRKGLQAELTKLGTYQYGVLESSVLVEQQKRELELAGLTNKKEEEAISARIVEAEVRLAKNKKAGASAESIKALDANLKSLEDSKKALSEEKNLRETILKTQQAQAVIANDFARSKEVLEYSQKEQDIRISMANIAIDAQEAELDYLSKVGLLSEENLINGKKAVEDKRIEVALEAEILQINRDKALKVAEISQARKMADAAPGADITGNKDREAADLDKVNSLAAKGIALAGAQAEQKAKYLGLLAEEEIRQLRINEAINSLTVIFGTLGTSVGNLAVVFDNIGRMEAKFAQDAAANTKDRIASEALLADAKKNGSADDVVAAEKDLNEVTAKGIKLEKDRAKTELANNTKLLGAAKGLFKEKTTAYKVLSATEKAMHAYKFAMDMKEIAIDAFKTGQAVINSFTRMGATTVEAGVDGTAAVVNQGKGDPYTAFARMAAMAAFVASILGGSKSGGKSAPSGFSAEGQQVVQGTGQAYVDGKLVNRGGGALGDPTAKAGSLTKSIELIEEHTFGTLEYSNRMLDNLKSIKSNTDNLSAILLQAGFNIKSSADLGLGTRQGSSSTEPISHQLVTRIITSIFGESSGIGKLTSKVTNAIFGGKTTAELQDMGVQINGAIDILAKGGVDIAKIYQNVKTTKDGGWFSSDKTWYDVVVTPLESKATEAIGNVFAGIIGTVKAAADTLGKDPSSVQNLISGFNVAFKASFKDLKPEELTEALNAEFSVAFNQLAEKVLPELQSFRKSGEEYGDTIVRLARDIQLTQLAFTSIGKSFADVSSTVEKVALVENLVELSGGLEKFLDKAAFFKDNFLTDEQKLAPVQSALSKRMNELGLSTITTRKQFADLILQLDVTNASQAQLYANLMDVSEAFAEVYPEVKKVANAEDLRTSKLQQQIEIYNLEGNTLAAIMATRQEELSLMDDRLVAGQLYIYALQDEADAKAKVKTAYEKTSSAINSTIKSLESSIKTLRTYGETLALGATSNLTPQEKYEEAKRQALSVATLATSIATTDAENRLKQEAIDKLPSVSAAFLDASRTIFASSEGYNRDFEFIQQLIDSTASSLENQKTAQEKQLDYLNAQVSALDLIQENTKTTTELMADFVRELSIFRDVQANTVLAAASASAGGYNVGTSTATAAELFASLFSQFNQNATSAPNSGTSTIPRIVASNDEEYRALIQEVAGVKDAVKALTVQSADAAKAVVYATYDTTEDLIDDNSSTRSTFAKQEWMYSRNRFNLA